MSTEFENIMQHLEDIDTRINEAEKPIDSFIDPLLLDELIDDENAYRDFNTKPENFKLSNLPILLHSDNYSNVNIHGETRMKQYLDMYPPLRNKEYCIVLNPFSYRFYDWIANNRNSLPIWGEKQLYLDNVCKHTIDEVCILPENKLVKIDDNVYCLHYEECTISRNVRISGIVFVDNETRWDSDKIRNWIFSLSKKLKTSDDDKKRKRMNSHAFDGIFLPEDILKDVISEINHFLNNRELYKNDLKLPWKRGYMLIGPAGNGKTSIIRAIRDYWGLKLYDVQKAIQKDGTINLNTFTHASHIDMILYPPEENPIVCVMEDIDKFIVYQSGGSRGNADAGKVTLHDVLKALDGIDQHDGVIVIATTNYGRDMSEAILNRPGRFDRIWKIDPPTEDNILKLLVYHNIKLTDGGELDLIVKGLKGFSMAFVAEFIKRVKTKFRRNEISQSEATNILDEAHRHNKIYVDYFKGRDKDHRDSSSMGF